MATLTHDETDGWIFTPAGHRWLTMSHKAASHHSVVYYTTWQNWLPPSGRCSAFIVDMASMKNMGDAGNPMEFRSYFADLDRPEDGWSVW